MERVVWLNIVLLLGYSHHVMGMDDSLSPISHQELLTKQIIDNVVRDIEPLLGGAKGQDAQQAAMRANRAVEEYKRLFDFMKGVRNGEVLRETAMMAQDARNQAVALAHRFDEGHITDGSFVPPTELQKRRFDEFVGVIDKRLEDVIKYVQRIDTLRGSSLGIAKRTLVNKVANVWDMLGRSYSAHDIDSARDHIRTLFIDIISFIGFINDYIDAKKTVADAINDLEGFLNASHDPDVQKEAKRLIKHAKEEEQKVFSLEIGIDESSEGIKNLSQSLVVSIRDIHNMRVH